MGVVRRKERERRLASAMCGPEVVAELLRRLKVESGRMNREPPPAAELAKELKTSEDGTSLEAIAGALKRRGLSAKGLQLSWKALLRLMNTGSVAEKVGRSLPLPEGSRFGGSRPLPGAAVGGQVGSPYGPLPVGAGPRALGQGPVLVALVSPGHYVIVEHANLAGVTAWDPDVDGTGRGARREYGPEQWRKLWSGVVLVVE
jgi:hypothetical protein